MSDSLNNKELVAVGHQLAKAMSSDTPIIDIAKMLSRLAERLDCTTAALYATQDQRDQLAAENSVLKSAIETHSESIHFCELCGKDDPCSTDDVCMALSETPATDAFLAEVRASTLGDLAKKKREEIMSLHPDTFALGSVIAALDMQANELEDLAAQLRQGDAK
ncbi:hypothetical protein [Enterobacter hormaechei]|nr:hypothetical protein [Enterobacter hormaechei]MBU5666974.1 hypothetical protein [Enterobacteriaceae bacterium S32_ASV_15]